VARRTAEELQLHHNKESHDGKATTVRGQKGLHAYTASNEMNVVPIGAETLGLKVNPATGKLKEAATYPIASPGKHNASPASEAANSLNTAPPAT
jgi:hypothetical protein